MSFRNCYADAHRAASYARLAFPGTYHLAFRDLPMLLGHGAPGSRALDFGCGAGRSTRFLRDLGFQVTGVDISAEMLAEARAQDAEGDYRQVPDGDLGDLPSGSRDRILSAFTFDNVPMTRKRALLAHLGRILAPGGRLLNLTSTPEIYTHEWASFSTRDFPGNRSARTGDRVHTLMKDVSDARPVEDILCTASDYAALYREAGLVLLERHHPLGREGEPFEWVSETRVAPWRIDVLATPTRPGAFTRLPGAGMVFGGVFGAV